MDRGNESLIAKSGAMLNMVAMLADTQNAQKSSSKEPVGRFSRNLISSIWGFTPNDDPMVTLTFFRQCQFWKLLLLYGKK